jgi:hypothetical protein
MDYIKVMRPIPLLSNRTWPDAEVFVARRFTRADLAVHAVTLLTNLTGAVYMTLRDIREDAAGHLNRQMDVEDARDFAVEVLGEIGGLTGGDA